MRREFRRKRPNFRLTTGVANTLVSPGNLWVSGHGGVWGLQTRVVRDRRPACNYQFPSESHCTAGDATSAYSLAFSSAIRRPSVCRFVSSTSSENILQKRSMLRRATMVSIAILVSEIVRVVIMFRHSPNFFLVLIFRGRGCGSIASKDKHIV